LQKFLQRSLPSILQLNKHGKFNSIIRERLSRRSAAWQKKKGRKERERKKKRGKPRRNL